jgi:hypothetical protein
MRSSRMRGRMDAEEARRRIVARFDGLDVLDTPDAIYVYYDPARDTPHDKRQPFATIVRTDAIDPASDLARRRLFRLNVGVERATYRAMFGPEPAWGPPPSHTVETGHDFTAVDTLLPHPVYAPMSWVSIIAPSEANWPRVLELLDEAHAKAKRSRRTRAVDGA